MSLRVTNPITKIEQPRRPNTSHSRVLSPLEEAVPEINQAAFSPGSAQIFQTQEVLDENLTLADSLDGVRFIPDEHPTPGESQVYIRGRGGSEDAYITLQYNPEEIPSPSKELPRSEILLPGMDPRILKQAQMVVREIRKEWKS